MTRQARRIATEEKLVAAVGQVLREKGVGGLGVNAVAARAGVDKALIYRYFENLPGLLRAYGESADFWPSLDEVLGEDRAVLQETDLPVLAVTILKNQIEGLRRRPQALEVLAWEIAQRNTLTVVLEEVRQARSEELFTALAVAGIALPGSSSVVATVFSAALIYLAARGRDIRVFGVLTLDDPGWQAIYQGIEATFRGLALLDAQQS